MQNWFHRFPGRQLRRPLRPIALGLVVAAMLPATALAASFKVTPHIANHRPIVNKKWPVELTVTKGRTKLSGTVSYEFLFEGAVVSHQAGHRFTRGIYRDTMLFPSQAVGQPLTLRILVTVKSYGTEHIDWSVEAHK
jgi:hypothetical protein